MLILFLICPSLPQRRERASLWHVTSEKPFPTVDRTIQCPQWCWPQPSVASRYFSGSFSKATLQPGAQK